MATTQRFKEQECEKCLKEVVRNAPHTRKESKQSPPRVTLTIMMHLVFAERRMEKMTAVNLPDHFRSPEKPPPRYTGSGS